MKITRLREDWTENDAKAAVLAVLDEIKKDSVLDKYFTFAFKYQCKQLATSDGEKDLPAVMGNTDELSDMEAFLYDRFCYLSFGKSLLPAPDKVLKDAAACKKVATYIVNSMMMCCFVDQIINKLIETDAIHGWKYFDYYQLIGAEYMVPANQPCICVSIGKDCATYDKKWKDKNAIFVALFSINWDADYLMKLDSTSISNNLMSTPISLTTWLEFDSFNYDTNLPITCTDFEKAIDDYSVESYCTLQTLSSAIGKVMKQSMDPKILDVLNVINGL